MPEAPLALIVEDDPTIRMLVGRSASRAGFALAEASDLRSLEAALATAEPALVVLDLTLGTLPPGELLAWLARLGCAAPLLPLTGWGGPETTSLLDDWRQRGLQILPLVSKPVHLHALTELLRHYLP